jgi:phenylacetate-coenzyme A ligase PaaK-like adenylate-forming protein
MFCFLGGVGVQEILLIGLFALALGIPLAIVVLLIKILQRNNGNSEHRLTIADSFGDSVILKNAGKLRELKSLQEKGIISHDEFELEKKRLLDS